MRSARPRCEAVPMPRHNMIIGGQTNAWGPNEAIPRWKQCLPSGRAEPAPPQRGSVHGRGRHGEGRKPREGSFSWRGALCAPASRRPTCGEASHDHRSVSDRQWPQWFDVLVSAVPSPMAFGGRPRETMASQWEQKAARAAEPDIFVEFRQKMPFALSI